MTTHNVLANSSNITSFRELEPPKWQLTWKFLWKLKAEVIIKQSDDLYLQFDITQNNRGGRSLFDFPLELSNMRRSKAQFGIQIDNLQQYINFVQFWKSVCFCKGLFVWFVLPVWSVRKVVSRLYSPLYYLNYSSGTEETVFLKIVTMRTLRC